MAYEFLKKLFGVQKDGEEPKAMTYAELEAAIDADKKIQVVDVKAGAMSQRKTGCQDHRAGRCKTTAHRCQCRDQILQRDGY